MDEAQIRWMIEKYADVAGLALNPDKERVNQLIKGLMANERKWGFRYCPCRVVTGDKKKDAKNICPCYWHKKELEQQGHCLCKLFFTKEKAEEVKKV